MNNLVVGCPRKLWYLLSGEFALVNVPLEVLSECFKDTEIKSLRYKLEKNKRNPE